MLTWFTKEIGVVFFPLDIPSQQSCNNHIFFYNQNKHLIILLSKVLLKCHLLGAQPGDHSRPMSCCMFILLRRNHTAAGAQYLTQRRCLQNVWSFLCRHINVSSSSHFSKRVPQFSSKQGRDMNPDYCVCFHLKSTWC